MSFRSKVVFVFLSALIAAYVFVGGWLGTLAQQTINDPGAQMRIFESVLQHIQNDYVEEPDLSKVRAGALRGLAYGLDPYSSYLTAEQVKDYLTKKNSKLVGIGAEFSQVSGYLYVISTVKGSPADKAGLKAGDVIEYIENKATRDISLYDAKQLLLGEPGTKVRLRVLRSSSKPQTIVVERGTYKIPEAESRIEEGKIGIIKVYSLEEGEAKDIRNQLQGLLRQGVEKIILDLRGVAAGTLNEAVEVANLFIKEGVIAQVIGRENRVLRMYTADPSKHLFDGKLVILIDVGTAGAAEVVASAILDRKRGEVIGEKSFGAGTEQELFTLRSGDGFLLTIAKWASASGKPFLGEDRVNSGVKPSIEVKRSDSPDIVDPEELIDQDGDEMPQTNLKSEQKPQEDLQLKKAIEILRDSK
ncbi:MAG: S41 family peptidase [Pyrinomonadaceae bacterium]|nr:S41 family peptidase [Pyrinomonadaceae bacterium]MCX7640129.1 S41 family peptidase [Pyrinomonadaceae bacterium]MDW8303283.1 S41 family peptidase [Acidobacteriota bacterium]